MILNELLTKQNFISKVLLKDGDKELSKDLKVKIVGMRVKMAKIRKEFDEDVQEAVKGFKPEGFDELVAKETKTEQEENQLKEWTDKLNSEYMTYINNRGMEEVNFEASLTDSEMAEIIDINADVEVDINGTKLNAPDFLEILYSLFVA